MREMISPGPFVGFLAVLALLGTVDDHVTLGVAGWAAGLGAVAAVALLLTHGLRAHDVPRLGPADVITLVRAVLACGVAALVAAAAAGPDPASSATLPLLVSLSSVALSLDAVDGAVARRTGTVSAFGARFDLEVDAFLILILSVHVARGLGWWVLAIGAWRYLLLAATALVPWLRQQVPARLWRKVVAAIQGIVLTVAATPVLAQTVASTAVIGALGLLTASFVTEIRTLWRLGPGLQPRMAEQATAPAATGRPVGWATEVDQWPA